MKWEAGSKPDNSGQHFARSDAEISLQQQIRELAASASQDPAFDLASSSHLFLSRQSLSRILYLHELYSQVLTVPGIICEFGVHWGAQLAALAHLRAILEPFNHSRHLIGFDTFEGFPEVDESDAGAQAADFALPSEHVAHLDSLLSCIEAASPLAHIKKYMLIPGNVSETVPAFLELNPQAVIAMAILDVDLYQPTRDILEAIRPRLVKGSVLVFDQLSSPNFPGETRAADEVLGLADLRLLRSRFATYAAYAIVGD